MPAAAASYTLSTNVRLQCLLCLQDSESLYMGLEHCPNGELYEQLQSRGPLPLSDAVQYAAEIVDILAYLRCGYFLVIMRGWCSAVQCSAAAAERTSAALLLQVIRRWWRPKVAHAAAEKQMPQMPQMPQLHKNARSSNIITDSSAPLTAVRCCCACCCSMCIMLPNALQVHGGDAQRPEA